MNYSFNNNVLRITLDSNYDGKPLSSFFETYSISKKYRHLYTQNKNILVNQEPIHSSSYTLHANDLLEIMVPEEEIDYPCADEQCEVVYEDEFVYVAHKPAGLIIHGEELCFVNYAATFQKEHHIHAPIRYIHRLDKETTGLVLFVKIPFLQSYYDQLLANRFIHRSYLAITSGTKPKHSSFTINNPIGKDRHHNGKYRVSSTGKEAQTHVQWLDEKKGFLLFRCELETGRTHQIRVHLSHRGYPIINDDLYGLRNKTFAHMCLWANQIVFPHPFIEKTIIVKDTFNNDYQLFKEIIE